MSLRSLAEALALAIDETAFLLAWENAARSPSESKQVGLFAWFVFSAWGRVKITLGQLHWTL